MAISWLVTKMRLIECRTYSLSLLLDCAASNPITGVSGRISHLVIGLRMNHERRARFQKRILPIFQADSFRDHLHLTRSVFGNFKIRQISGVRTLRFGI